MQTHRLLCRVVLGASVAALSMACDKSSDFETYKAILSSAEENPPNSSTATGVGTLLLSKNGDRADVSVTVSGLSAAPTGCHIHRAARGTNGGIVFYLWANVATDGPFDPQNTANLGRSWLPDTNTIDPRSQGLTAQNLADLRAGNLYLNVHSTARPGGEIRGQWVRQ